MTVLTLAGKPINWRKPPKPTTRVMWSQRTTGGKTITGSLRTIAHLDHLNTLALKKFGVGISVLQGPYNTTVAASAGTHDFDACLDVWIPGVDGFAQQGFFRANGGGAYYRRPEQGFTPHIHYFTLPRREGVDPSDDFRSGGFKVGKYVDGGWSTAGRKYTSAQIDDYYNHASALSGHAHDPSWFPPNIEATIFDLPAYVTKQRIAMGGMLAVMTANIASQKSAPELRPVLREHRPDVVVIEEAYFAREFLSGIDGYRNLQYTRKKYGSEGPDIAVLVRKGVKVSRRRALTMVQKWIGPKGGKHDGRVYPSLNVQARGVWWRLLGIHFPTHNNEGAQNESEQAVIGWLGADERPSVAPGDFNQTHEEIEHWLKRGMGAALGTKVDHAVYARCMPGRVTRLHEDQPEGMHGWVLYRFTTE